MKNIYNKAKIFKNKSRYLFLFLILISLSFLGSNCEKILNELNNNTTPGDILGSWKLVKQTGALQDICSDETVTYQSDNTALLKCPNQQQITRTYSISNDVLTYTETNVSYYYQVTSNGGVSQLILEGKNINRNLTYNKITADNINESNKEQKNTINSSEFNK